MSIDDVSQIIDRLARIEDKQDIQGEKIENLRIAMAAKSGESSGAKTVKGDIFMKMASYGGLLAGISAMVALFWRSAK